VLAMSIDLQIGGRTADEHRFYTNLSKTERESGPHIRDANGLKPKRRTGPSVGERLQAAYEKVMAKKAKG
jgi:hypothetical protein